MAPLKEGRPALRTSPAQNKGFLKTAPHNSWTRQNKKAQKSPYKKYIQPTSRLRACSPLLGLNHQPLSPSHFPNHSLQCHLHHLSCTRLQIPQTCHLSTPPPPSQHPSPSNLEKPPSNHEKPPHPQLFYFLES